MYSLKTGKQSKAFLKCLFKAALKGKLPKKYICQYFKMRGKSVIHIIMGAMGAMFYEIRTISVAALLCVAVGASVSVLALNVCELDVKVDSLKSEKAQLTETKQELEEDIQVLINSLQSNEQDSDSKDKIIEEQKNALESSESEKQEIIRNFTERIDGLDFTGTSTSRSTADLNAAKANIGEIEILIRTTLDDQEAANVLVTKLNQKADQIQDVMDRYPNFFPTIGRDESTFGYRRDPITGETRYHSGMDIDTGSGVSVWAAGKGTVINTSYDDGGYGYNICIEHGNGLTTRYAHLSKILVNTGTVVNKGDLIGLTGSTGRSTGPHLHFEVIENEACIDPVKFVGSGS